MSTQRPIGVIGAGNMGSGIAQKIATEGLPVVLVDVDMATVNRGMQRIRTLLNEGVQRRIFTPAQVEQILGRIHPTSELPACKDCELVIEAVFEDLDLKRDLLRKLDVICRPDTRLATNTSSFFVRDVADATRRPDRVLGMHFFYHPAKNRLVELIGGTETSAQTLRWAWTFAEVIGKTPIASADAPGFVVNRYFVPWVNEAIRLLEAGMADIPTIEAAAKEAFHIGMGPFELMNVTGVPIAMHAATTLGEELGPFYAPAPLLVRQGEAERPWSLAGDPDRGKFAAVADRLQAVTFYVAAQMVDEGVCTVEDADIGARVGLRWELGPFQLMNRAGLAAVVKKVESLAALYPQVQVPKLLRGQADLGKPFVFQLVRLRAENGLAEITINRPDALNALNEEVIDQLAHAFDDADRRPDVRTIVLRGAGKAFVAGADVKSFLESLAAKDLDRIYAFTQKGQALFKRIDASAKLVIARLDGLSLGGGTELALCADYIIATERGSLGFPETGIGIYPGLGGTQRAARRVGVGLARYLILSGDTVDAVTALTMGLVDDVVRTEQIGERILQIHKGGKRPAQAEPDLDEWLTQVQELFEGADLERLLKGAVGHADPSVAKAAGKVRHKAPIACRMADRMIREGAERGVEHGLEMELSHLKEIFSTDDAHEGLSALVQGRRPTFQGK